MNLKIKHFLYSFFAGLIFSFALPPIIFPVLEWVAFIPFLGIILFDFNKKKDYFILGFVSGFIAMGKYLFWFFGAAPLTWLNINSVFLSYMLVGIIWFLMVFYFALWFGLFILFVKYFQTGKIWDIFLISFSWPILEFLRTYIFNFYLPVIGTGSVVGDHMALGLFGYALAGYSSLRQWAAVGGDYFLSFILVSINALIFYILIIFIHNKKLLISNAKLFFNKYYREIILASFSIILLVTIFICGGKYLNGKYILLVGKIDVAAIQFDFPVDIWSAPRYSSSTVSLMNDRFGEAAMKISSPGLIVMPEGADITDFSRGFYDVNDIKKILGKNYQVVVSGDFKATDKNNVFLAVFDNSKGLIGTYAKQFLMPLGEYLPVAFQVPISLLFSNWGKGLIYRWFSPGRQPGVFSTQFGNVGALACSEIISPELIREEAAQGAQVIAFSASDSIFRGSEELHSQNLAMAQIRATETRRSLVYASNGERSFIVDPLGNILWQADNLDFQNGYARITLNSALSPYDKFGDWFVYLSLFILSMWITLVVFLK